MIILQAKGSFFYVELLYVEKMTLGHYSTGVIICFTPAVPCG